MTKSLSGLLAQVTFSILLALSLKPRHGYELIQQVSEDSGGRVQLGAGALYGAIKQLREAGFIEEMPFEGDPRRRYYRLTVRGWDALRRELVYYRGIVDLSEKRSI